MRRVLLGLAAAIAVSAPAAGQEPLDTITVGPNAIAKGDTVLEAGTAYPLSVSGTMTVTRDGGTSIEQTYFRDALFCFQSEPPSWCSPMQRWDSLYIKIPEGLLPIGNITQPSRAAPYAASHEYDAVYTPSVNGPLEANTAYACTGSSVACTGPGFKIDVHSPPCTGGSGQGARAAAINEVHVVAVTPGAQVHAEGTPPDRWCDAQKDMVLKQGDEIGVDPDGSITLRFADGSTVTVRNTTQLKLASFFTEGGVVRTEIVLKMGEVSAKVNKSEATKSDFRIKSPTGTSSARGTELTVFADPGSKASITSVKSGSVKVDPTKGGLPSRLVGKGKEVETTPSSISKVVAIGKAGARGGVNRDRAHDLITKLLAFANGPCGFATPRVNAFSVKPARDGWTVTAKLTGKLTGSATWLVQDGDVRAVDAEAKRILKGCG